MRERERDKEKKREREREREKKNKTIRENVGELNTNKEGTGGGRIGLSFSRKEQKRKEGGRVK